MTSICTYIKYLFSFFFAILLVNSAHAQTCNTVSLPADTLYGCTGTAITLSATITGTDSQISISWSPAAGLSSTTILNPVLTTSTSGWYTISVTSLLPENLVVNGNFSAGNTGFSSSYNYQTTCCTFPQDYEVATDPRTFYSGWPVMGDHTTGTGNMLMVDGASSSSTSFWCETIAVTPNTTYIFSLWSALFASPLPSNQIKINGTVVGTYAPSSTVGIWTQYQVAWNSGAATSADICMYDLVTGEGGNDFGIDDISFEPECIAKDSIYINTAIRDTAHITNDTAVCASLASITLTAPAGYTSYNWSNGATTSTITVATTGTYWVLETGTCLAQTDTFHVTFNPLTVTTITTDTAVCAPVSVITLTAPAGFSSYNWSSGATTSTILARTSGIYWVYGTAGCAAQTDTFHVTFKPQPLVNLGNDTTFCSGNSVILQSSDGPYTSPTYFWSTGGTSPSISVSATGDYSLSVTVNGCSGSDNVNITVTPTPPAPLLSSNGPVCSGNLLQLTAALAATYTNAATYSWSGPNSFTSILQNPAINPATTAAAGTYTVFASFDGCTSSLATEVVSVGSAVAITVTSPVTICQNSTIFLTASADTTGIIYNWTGPLSFSSTQQDPVIANADTIRSGTYTVTAALGTCFNTATVVVTVNPIPVFLADSSNAPVCAGSTLNLYSTFTDELLGTASWEGPNGFTSTLQNPAITAVTLAATGVYSVSETQYGCTSATYTLSVTIDPVPLAPTITSNSPVCIGGTLNLTGADGTAGVIYSWLGPNGFSSALQDPSIVNIIAADGGIYTLTVTSGICSASSTSTISTSVFKPTNNGPLCTDDTLFLYANGSPGAVYIWSGPYGYYAYDSTASSTRFILNVTPENAGVYTVTALLTGCTTAETDTVIINPKPAPPFISGLTYCQYYPAPPLQVNDTGILWYPLDTIANGSTIVPTPLTDTVGSAFYFVTQTVNGCISIMDSIKVTVNPKPIVTINPANEEVCPHSTLVLTAVDADANAVYHWSPSIYLNDTTTASVIASPETDVIYTVVAGNQYGCTDTATANVVVYPAALIYLGDSVTLYPGEVYTMNPSGNCTSFNWFPPDGLSNSLLPDPVASPGISTKYILYGQTENGCTTSDSISIYISANSLIALPNAFTPGNGPNNQFKVIKKGIVSLNYFRIFNRWGQKVFETTNIDAGWDGTFNGSPQPFDVYIYEVEAISSSGQNFHVHGNFTLLR